MKAEFILIGIGVGLLVLFVVQQQSPLVVSNSELSATDSAADHQKAGLLNEHSSKKMMNQELPVTLKNTSLKGTKIDGIYPVDAQGNLLISKDIKQRFEYFLSTMGEFELEHVLNMIKDDISDNLNSPAKEQALKLFDDYVAYKFALSELEASLNQAQDYEMNDVSRMRFQLEQMRDVRREYLGIEAVDAFFGFDEMYDDFMLASLEVKNNRQLTAKERQEQLKSLEQSLPQDVQEMRNETQRVSQVFLQTEQMKKEGGSDDEIYALNEQEFGQEAAQRLQELNQQRNKWQSRVDGYLQQKSAILSDESMTDKEQKDAVNTLKASGFESSEFTKLSAYELMHEEAEAQ